MGAAHDRLESPRHISAGTCPVLKWVRCSCAYFKSGASISHLTAALIL
jgi:hypothetical protein